MSESDSDLRGMVRLLASVSDRPKVSPKRAFAIAGLILVVAGCAPPDPRQSGFRREREGVVAEWDPETGRLKKIELDRDKNGKMDTFSFMDGTRFERIEIDLDENGIIERWEYYVDNKLTKVGSSSRADGVPDQWDYPSPEGSLARVEFDLDRDGHIDKWERFDPPHVSGGSPILREVGLDLDAEGRAARRLLYGADGSFQGVVKDR